MVPTLLVLVFLTFGTLTYIMLAPSTDEITIWKRTSEIRRRSFGRTSLEDEILSLPFTQRVLGPLFERIYLFVLRYTPSQMKDAYRRKLQQAGKPMETAQFLGIKLLTVAVGLMLGMVMSTLLFQGGDLVSRAGLALTLIGLGLYLPDFWLSQQISKRQKALERALPEVLDLLSVSVEAGLGFDGAIQKVAEKFREPVATEFNAYLKEVRLGKARADALRNLADRSGLPDLQAFVASIIQADQLGVSFTKVLRVQSDQLRIKRKQRAEEKAAKIPIKIMLPLVGFIFPTLFVVILGPAAISIYEMFLK